MIDVKDLPEGEKIYLEKRFGSWQVVVPIKKDVTQPLSWKNINWFNLITGGSWFRLAVALGLTLVFCLFLLEYSSNMRICAEFMARYRPLI